MQRRLNVCVIGAGLSGLVAIKELIDEGHDVHCFERQAREGGNFNYPSGASYDAMRLSVSQHFMAFSSFPPPLDEKRRFWTREEYANYLNAFAAHFNLFRHITFRTEVLGIRRDEKGLFHVEYRDTNENASRLDTFDAVAMCSGAHAPDTPRIPRFPGADKFQGEVIHSTQYKTPEPFRGKRVVCVGFGETAADIAVQIAEVAAFCCASFRRYPYLIPRYTDDPKGETSDSRSARLAHRLPRSAFNRVQLNLAKATIDAPLTSTSPRQRFIADWRLKCGTPAHQPAQKTDEFIDSVLNGKLKIRPFGVKRLEGRTVIFTDDSRVDTDVLMCCTGFEENKPPELVEGFSISNVRELYKHVFHPDFGPRLAFIGWARPVQGGVPACSEMQSRLFALFCSGKRQLPEQDELRSAIAKDRKAEEQSFFVRKDLSTLCVYTTYMESVAELVGCRPRLRDFLLEPRLAYRLLCGSNIALTYRLVGPHSNPELARRAIMSLPLGFSKRALVTLGILYILSRLGLLRENH